MKTRRTTHIIATLICLAALAAGAEGDKGVIRMDCRPGSCPTLTIKGDRPSTYPNGRPAGFRGFSDPCLRQDPATGRLWMVYSWPHMKYLGPGRRDYALGVETHLASSGDHGRTWKFDQVLWPRTPAKYRPARGGAEQEGWISHEVPNIVPIETSGKPAWAAARLDYFLPRQGNYKARNNRSFCLRVLAAPTVPALGPAPYFTFGHDYSSPECGVNVNLTRLSPDFPASFIPNEPALFFKDGRLYLAFVVMTFQGKTPDFGQSFIAVLSTEPRGDVESWRWKYLGKLAANKEAAELGGEGLTQIELALGKDGKLLAFLTPEAWDPQARGGDAFYSIKHFGCAVIEVASLDPPALAHNPDGSLARRAWIFSSAQSANGPGAAGYDPASLTGVIFTLRDMATRGNLSWSLHSTGLKP